MAFKSGKKVSPCHLSCFATSFTHKELNNWIPAISKAIITNFILKLFSFNKNLFKKFVVISNQQASMSSIF